MAGRTFLRQVGLVLDAEARGKFMAEFERVMASSGELGAAKMRRALDESLKLTIAKLQKDLADGLIDQRTFAKLKHEAERGFVQALSKGMDDLRSKGKLTDAEMVKLAGDLAKVTQSADRSAKDFARLSSEMDRSQKEAKELGNEMGRAGGKVSEAGGGIASELRNWAAAFFAADRLKEWATRLFEVGTAAEETQSKFATTFGQSAASVQGWLDRNAQVMGLNKTVAQDYAATMGAVVQGMGATRAESAEFSTQILKLAGDLTSFHNVPIDQVLEKLRAGLTGEMDGLKELGIVILDAAVKERALKDTHKSSADELSNLELAQARYNLIVEQAGPAIGDLARTQDSTANKTRYLKAELENLEREIALQLLPAFGGIVDGATENSNAIKDITHWFMVFARVGIAIVYNNLASFADLLTGVVLVAIGTVMFNIRKLQLTFAEAGVAWAKTRKWFGGEDHVAEAEADLREARRLVAAAEELTRQGFRNIGRSTSFVTGRYTRQVINAKPAGGDVQWSAPTPENNAALRNQQEKDRQTAQEQEIERLQQGLRLHTLTNAERRRAADLERQFNQTARDTSKTLAERNEAQKQADQFAQARLAKRPGETRANRDAEQDQINLLKETLQQRRLNDQELATARALEQRLSQAINSGTLSVTARTKALQKLRTIQEQILPLQERLSRAREINIRITVSRRDDVLGDGADRLIERRMRAAEKIAQARQQIIDVLGSENLGSPEILGALLNNDALRSQILQAVEIWREGHAEMLQASQSVASGVMESFGQAFALLFQEGADFGTFFQSLGVGMARSLLGALSQYAGGKIVENIAHYFDAKALAATYSARAAEPLNPLAPFYVAAAVKMRAAAAGHLKAAAGWAVLGGVASGAGAAIGGGGGGGGGDGGAKAAGGGGVGSQQQQPSTIPMTTGGATPGFVTREPQIAVYINQQIDGFNPQSPTHIAKLVIGAGNAVELHGADVFTKPRGV